MAETYPDIKGVDVSWGVGSSLQAGTGYTTEKASHEQLVELKLLKNAAGATATVVMSDPSDKLTLEVYPSGATKGTLPELGSTVTVNSIKYMAMPGTKEDHTNSGEQRMTFVLQKWPGITLT